MEIWKTIDGFENYQVSNLGNVKSLKFGKERLLKQVIMNNGYLSVGLCINGISKTKTIHQLVAMSFLNHKICGYELVVNHKNLNKLDNKLKNLEIITNRENSNQKHVKSTSKYIGVYWNKNAKKWKACIRINGKQNYLGYYKTEIEASNAYQKALLAIL